MVACALSMAIPVTSQADNPGCTAEGWWDTIDPTEYTRDSFRIWFRLEWNGCERPYAYEGIWVTFYAQRNDDPPKREEHWCPRADSGWCEAEMVVPHPSIEIGARYPYGLWYQWQVGEHRGGGGAMTSSGKTCTSLHVRWGCPIQVVPEVSITR